MRASCYWKWIRGDLHSERRSRERNWEAARGRTKGSVGKVRNKEGERERERS